MKRQNLINEHWVLTNTDLDLQTNFHIHITVNNDVQMDQLEAIKVDLLTHLRHTLKNNAIRLHATVTAVQTKERKFFTDEDKLKFLSEHYPVVMELRKKFGLEINY